MQRIREAWNLFRNIAIILSFIVNIILIVVLLVAGVLIFEINQLVEYDLLGGLHTNFKKLNDARIVADVPVDDEIPISFTLPLEQETDVVLSDDVTIEAVPAVFVIDGGGGTITGTVDIVLPKDTILPVKLDLDVPVDQQIPISLTVGVDIPLNETELSEPFTGLEEVVNPYVELLDALPDDLGQTGDFAVDALRGRDWYDEVPPAGVVRDGSTSSDDETSTTQNNGGSNPVINPTPTFTPFPTFAPSE